jgi:L-ascorbate metabolism protein UlaG (beta-lactamase superfamily)
VPADRPINAIAPPTRPIGRDAFAASAETALWWLGGAGFLINARGRLIAIDPAVSMEPGSSDRSEVGMRLLVPHPIDATEIPRLDLVLYTHSDLDHLAPVTARELMRTDATFVGPRPVAAGLRELGLPDDRLRVIGPGERFELGGVEIETTPADHAWQRMDPAKYGPPFGPDDCVGFLVRTPDGAIWHTGDTVLLDEHRRARNVDVLLLDVSRDHWHLGPTSAAELADALGAPHLIPHHYGCYDAPDFPAVNGDPAEVAAMIEDGARRMHVLAPGERFVLRR